MLGWRDYPGVSGWVQQGLRKRKAGRSETEKQRWEKDGERQRPDRKRQGKMKMSVAGSEDEGRGREPRTQVTSKLGRAKEQVVSRGLQRGPSWRHLHFSSGKPASDFWPPELWEYECVLPYCATCWSNRKSAEQAAARRTDHRAPGQPGARQRLLRWPSREDNGRSPCSAYAVRDKRPTCTSILKVILTH